MDLRFSQISSICEYRRTKLEAAVKLWHRMSFIDDVEAGLSRDNGAYLFLNRGINPLLQFVEQREC